MDADATHTALQLVANVCREWRSLTVNQAGSWGGIFPIDPTRLLSNALYSSALICEM